MIFATCSHIPGRFSTLPPVPDWFNLLEREAWDTLIAALEPMGVVTLSDGPALTLLAHTWAEWRQAEATVDLEGAYYAHGDDIRRHPAVGVAANAWRRGPRSGFGPRAT